MLEVRLWCPCCEESPYLADGLRVPVALYALTEWLGLGVLWDLGALGAPSQARELAPLLAEALRLVGAAAPSMAPVGPVAVGDYTRALAGLLRACERWPDLRVVSQEVV